MELPERGQPDRGPAADAVEGRRLVRVLAVSELLHAVGLEGQAERPRIGLGGRARRERVAVPQVGGDRRVVLGGAAEGVVGETLPGRRREASPARPELGEHGRVLGGVGDHRHARRVLRGRPDQRGTAHVDLLDRLGPRDARAGDRPLERVEGDGDEVDRRDAVALEGGHVLGRVAAGQDAAVDHRVEGLHPPVEELGEAGHLRDVADGEAGLPEELGGAAGREDLRAERGEAPGELDQAALVVRAQQGSTDPGHARDRGSVSSMITRRPTIRSRPSA